MTFNQSGGHQLIWPLQELSLLSETLLHGLYDHSDGLYILQKNSFSKQSKLFVFSSAECFGTEFREFASNFCSTEWNSELFSFPLKGSEEGVSESLLLYLFH